MVCFKNYSGITDTKLVLVGLLFLLISPGLIAQPNSFRDHPLFARFPDSEITDIEFVEDVNYRLVLSSLQRTRGLVSSEASERIRGDVTKIIYEVSNEFSGQDVYDYFREQIQRQSYTELFTCVGRECGSSNYWANDVFRNRVLYGPERNQFYLAFRAGPEAELSPHMALYIITRGNRRLYAYFEVVEIGGTETRIDIVDTTDLISTLESQSSIVIPGISFEDDLGLTDNSDLTSTVNLLQADPSLRVYLVVHLSGDEDVDALIQRSQQRSNVLRQLLIGRGIDGNRIIAKGVGPLAPSCNVSVCGDRVELVLQ